MNSFDSLETPDEKISEEKAENAIRFPKSFDEFKKLVDELKVPEEKLEFTIQYMEQSLSQHGCPNFKNFWESRKLCLEIFKETIPPPVRSLFWGRYRDLSKEARKLKELLDEQSAFAVEQIEIAITALEKNVSGIDQVLACAPQAFEAIPILQEHYTFYNNTQRELNVLNNEASSINALRKELIKTEMRVRFKNKFFQRLSVSGDKIFPKRKELIKELSQTFCQHVEAFIEEYFENPSAENHQLYAIRDQIKGFQGLAKLLTLNTQAFNQTRVKLSECWEKVKVLEKEKKKEWAQKRSVFKENADKVSEKIDALAKQIKTLSVDKALEEINSISKFMRDIELGKEEVHQLRSKLFELRDQVTNKEKSNEQEKRQKEIEKEQKRKEVLDKIKQDIETLISQVDSYDIEKITAARDELLEQIQSVTMSKFEKHNFERLLKPIKDVIADKKERALSSLSDDEKEMLKNCKDLLAERKERSKEIREQIEVYRKAKGSSVCDFEKALCYNEQLNIEKERLEKVNQGILEIQEKIKKLEDNTHTE